MNSRILTLYAETSLHPGTGQTTGVVDLPIQRERHTGFPKIEATGLKGSLRSVAERRLSSQKEVIAIFGPETSNASDHAGALALTDARLLAFPVRSLTDVFVWITCPKVIERLRRDMRLGGLTDLNLPAINPGKEEAWITYGSPIGAPLVLEELSFITKKDSSEKGSITSLGSKIHKLLPQGLDRINTHLVVLEDKDFAYFVQHATQVSARIALTGGKTTGAWTDPTTGNPEKGNLWYEETLPPETIMYSLLIATDPRDEKKAGIPDAAGVLKKVEGIFQNCPYLQVGGNETVGQGWCAIQFSGGTP